MSKPVISDVRGEFLKFFEQHGHTRVASSPLVPNNDPTLMFVNSGMVQFKDLFTGREKRAYTRATTSQKSVRAGGKHNDLDNVGYTGRHLTFFEMLGNFSFGDYFKKEALTYAWELVTKVFGLPIDRLYVTIYAEDDEAFDIWTKVVGVAPDRVIRIGDNKGARYASDNFWAMGDTGPCGPCSEIFYDYGPQVAGGLPGTPDADGDRYVEIWNNVFMQFERHPDGTMTKLPRPCVDTGMGLERITSVLEGKTSIWDAGIIRQLIEAIAKIAGQDPDGANRFSLRIIADHLRTSCFLVAEGVLPSNEGRGYVLRRIMRRAMRHAHLIGSAEPLMYRLVASLIGLMGEAYPELVRNKTLIEDTLRNEETRFRQTLERGLKLLEEEVTKLGSSKKLPGETAFKLYDTYGFPLDLTQDALRDRGIEVDVAGFEAAMAEQKAMARQSWVGSGDAATAKIWFELREELGSTEFMGYENEVASGNLLAIVANGKKVESAKAGDEVQLILNQSPFYAESGGQVGDTGSMTTTDGTKVTITNTTKEAGSLWVHHARIEAGTLKVGAALDAVVDGKRRSAIRANHSATHLLHEALRRRLGGHVAQKGSLVTPQRLRFDFAQPIGLTAEDIAVIEAEVNQLIRENSEVVTRVMSPKDAEKLGARALFGEKYGDEVRVLSMGGTLSVHGLPSYSLEFCGGTHARRLGDIGLFKIVSESSVASGVRRIEALTGEGALAYLNGMEGLVKSAASSLVTTADEQLLARISQLQEQLKAREQTIKQLRLESMKGGSSSGNVIEVAGVKLDARVGDWPARDLKPMADELKKGIGSGVIALISTAEGKASIVVGVTSDLTSRINAVDLAKAAAEACGGKGGGGRPDMAQAGGPDASRAASVVDVLSKVVSSSAAA